MTDEDAAAASAVAAPDPASISTDTGADAGASGRSTVRGAARRSRWWAVPVPTAVTAALVAGMFGLLFVSLNGINGALSDIRSEISDLRAEIGMLQADMNAGDAALRSETQGTLLDHTGRLSRIETYLELQARSGISDAAAADAAGSAQSQG